MESGGRSSEMQYNTPVRRADLAAISEHAIVGAATAIGASVSIGPFSVIGDDPSSLRSRFHGTPLAVVASPEVVLGDEVTIGAHCVIEAGVVIGDRCYIDHGCFIGADTVLDAGVFVRYRAQLHRRVRIGAGSIVGGFVCNDTVIGRDCDLFASFVHRYVGAQRGAVEPAPVVGDRVFAGFGAVVIGPTTVPDDAVIPAGMVVRQSTELSIAVRAPDEMANEVR